MSFHFDSKKAIHIVLYVLRSLGGSADTFRLFSLLYLSDLRHLSRHGSLITGDTYIALKLGPAPFHIHIMLREAADPTNKINTYTKTKVRVDHAGITAIGHHDPSQLSASEAECLFESIQYYKNIPAEMLSRQLLSKAWLEAGTTGEIDLANMIAESGATPVMSSYILMCRSDETGSFSITCKEYVR